MEFPTELIKEELKSVAKEKCEFDFGDNSRSRQVSFLDYQDFVSKIKINETLLETYFKTEKLPVDSFMQENKLAVMKKDAFKHGDRPIIRKLNQWTNKTLMQGSEKRIRKTSEEFLVEIIKGETISVEMMEITYRFEYERKVIALYFRLSTFWFRYLS